MSYVSGIVATNKPAYSSPYDKSNKYIMDWKNSLPFTMAIIVGSKPIKLLKNSEDGYDEYVGLCDLRAGVKNVNLFINALMQESTNIPHLTKKDPQGAESRTFNEACQDFLNYINKIAKKYKYVMYIDGFAGIHDNPEDYVVNDNMKMCQNFVKRGMPTIIKKPSSINNFKPYSYDVGPNMKSWEWSMGLPYKYELKESIMNLSKIPQEILFENL